MIYTVYATLEGRAACPDYQPKGFSSVSEALDFAFGFFPNGFCFYILPTDYLEM